MRAYLSAVLLAAIVAPSAFAAGVTFTFDSPDGAKTLQFDNDRMREEEGDRVFIFDGKKMIEINTVDRTYQVIDPEAVKQMMASYKAQLDGMLKNLPPEQRAQAEKAAKQRAPKLPVTTYQRGAGSDTAAGIRCDWYRTVVDGNAGDDESCYAPWASIGMKKSDFKVFDKMKEFAKSMAEAAGGVAAMASYSDAFEKIPGAPIIEARVEDGKRVVQSKLTGLKRGSVPDDRFRAPAGFRQVKMTEFQAAPSKSRPPRGVDGDDNAGEPSHDEPQSDSQ